MAVSYFKATFQDKNGKKITKEFTSTTKTASQLRTDTIAQYKQRGYKYVSGGMGTRSK